MNRPASEPTPQNRPSLKVHEWLAVTAFVGGLTVLTTLSVFSNHLPAHNQTTHNPHYLVHAEIEVFVEGSVEHPGVYQVKSGTLLKDVLSLAQPTPNADLRRLKLESPLRNGRVIKVPAKRQKTKKT